MNQLWDEKQGLKRKTGIFVHHSLTKDSGTVSWDAIRKYHVETNGWRAVGYHAGIELVDYRYEVLRGRPLHESAAAVKEGGANTWGLHLCLIGNFDLAPPPKEQWLLALSVVREWLGIIDQLPQRVFGHREFAAYKSCPGTKFDMDQFRRELSA